MKDQTPFSIKLIYWLTNLVSALFLLIIIAVITFKILFHFDALGGNYFLHIGLPNPVMFTESGTINLDGEVVDVVIKDAYGKMGFQNTPKSVVNWVSWALMIVVLIGAFILWSFRRFIKNVRNNMVFTVENINYLKHVAYGLFGFWLFDIIYKKLIYHYIVKHLEFEHLKITGDMDYGGNLLMVALFIWVLSHIFITGFKMKEDLDLTV